MFRLVGKRAALLSLSGQRQGGRLRLESRQQDRSFRRLENLMRYLITGGAGFIGGALARRLHGEGHAVTLLDLPEKWRRTPADLPGSHIGGDISRRETFRGIEGGFDAVFHLAAQTSARISHEEPERDVDTNARGTLLLAQWCLSRGIRRIFHASSMAIYGNPSRLPVVESDLPSPVSFYGVTKLAGEHYLLAHKPLGLEPTIFRLFNVYGPGQDMTNLKQGMVSIYLAYLSKGEEIPVTGSLDRFRDFVFIDDVIDAWMAAISSPRSQGRVYNIGTGETATVRQVLDLLIRAWGLDPLKWPVREIEPHAGDVFGMRSDSSRFRADFGWSPRVPLEEGIGRMVSWLRGGMDECALHS